MTGRSPHKNNILPTVLAHCCHSCSACVAVCPRNALEMRETLGGFLEPIVHEERCNHCGLCLEVCSGKGLPFDIFPTGVDPFEGNCQEAYCGYATDETIREKGQSGGYATAILCHLFASGQITAALVTKMPPDGSFRPQPFLARTAKQLKESQGSLYCPVPLLSVLRDIDLAKEKLAIVALPCQAQSIRLLLRRFPTWRSSMAIIIGLMCERTLSYLAIDALRKRTLKKTPNEKSIRYKDKAAGGWPGNITFLGSDGKKRVVASRRRHLCKGFFTPLRCHLCFDKMNIFSDIVLGDAWGVLESKEGHSVAVARTQAGQNVLKSAMEVGGLNGDRVNYAEILRGQGVQRHREFFLNAMRIRKNCRAPTPSYNGLFRLPESLNVKGHAIERQLSRSLSLQCCTDRSKCLARVAAAIFWKSALSRATGLPGKVCRITKRFLRLYHSNPGP